MKANPVSPGFGTLIQAFFCDRLIQQQNVSSRTVSSYRDTFRLLLGFLEQQHKKPPAMVTLADLDAPLVVSFLDHLENARQNGIRTRNARLAAIRSFLKYAASRDPVSLPVVQRVLAIPMKRFARPGLTFLSRDEVAALLKAPDDSTWSGRRDRVLFAVLYNTGARVSEAIALRRTDVSLDGSRSVCLTGKGRKQRTVPLWKSTVESLRSWMALLNPAPETLVFPNRAGKPLSRSGVEKRLGEAMHVVATHHPSARAKTVSPHTLRHTTAMHLLQSGVDITVIALWLGHESTETTHQYVEANLAMKEEALSKLEEVPLPEVRFRPADKLLEFLEGL